MTWSLFVLCLAAFAMVALLSSIATGAVLPGFDRLALAMTPRRRARLWLALAALPGAAAALAVLVSLLPALGFGSDHCLEHGAHHPHLCPHHVGAAPGIVLVAVAVLAVARAMHVAFGFVRALRLSYATSRALAEASDRRDGVLVFASEEPQAFVLGALRPRIHASHGLFALDEDVVAPVLAHERSHAGHRDLLWRALCPVFGAGHLPSVGWALGVRLAAAQEMAADFEAAEALPDGRLKVAEALVTLAKLRTPAAGLAFTQGDIEARVVALLEPRCVHASWPARVLVAGFLALPVAAGLAHDVVHHGLETLLGALS
jgi:hypothetical protein